MYQREAGEAIFGSLKGAEGVKHSPQQSGGCGVGAWAAPEEGCSGCRWFPWKGHPLNDAEDPKITIRRRGAPSSPSLPGARIPWVYQLLSLLTGDLEIGISSCHITWARSRWGFFEGGCLNYPPHSPHLHRPLLGPPKLQVPVPGLTGEPNHQDGGGGREALVRLPKPRHRPQHHHVGARGTTGDVGRGGQ